MRRIESLFIEAVMVTLIIFASTSLILSVTQGSALNNNLAAAIRIAAAKCPGIPGGSTSGGIDFINIAIDVGLVALLGLFLVLTIRDMRTRRRTNAKKSES